MGQHIDIAMIDATLATDDQVHYALEDSEASGPLRNDTWETGAGPILISADFRYLWHLLTGQMGVNDPTSKNTPLAEKIRIRRGIVGEYLANLASWAEVEEAMAAMNLAWGRVRAPMTLRDQPTIAARKAIVEIDDRIGGTRPITQSPYRFSGARSGVRGPAPHRGEHNSAVLVDWLSKSPVQISQLHSDQVLQFDGDFVQQ
ncbi:MAG: hypothetical protein CBB90_05030 [Gammaproteobacteria bacterium TMED30]|nr:MAG: hypothetical protein CBB90_05030 [Gammaproteobacteria bacterium TMED30]